MAEPLEILLRIKDEASAALQNVAAKGKEVEGQMTGMRAAFTAAGAALTGIGLLGLKSMNDWTDAAARAEQSHTTMKVALENSLKSMNEHTIVVGGNTAAHKENAKQLQESVKALNLQREELRLSQGDHKAAIQTISQHINATKLQGLELKSTTTTQGHAIQVANQHQYTLAELTDTVEKLSQKYIQFGFDNKETETVMSKNILVTHDLAKAQELLQIQADVAAQKNIGLAEAQAKVNLVMMGSGRVLKEFGIEATKKMDKDTLLAKLADKVHGQAQAHSQDEIVMQRRLSIEYENMQASLGEGLLPMKKQLIEAVSTLLQKFNDLSPATREFISQAVLIGTGFALIVGPILTVIGLWPILSAGFAAASTAMLPVVGIIGVVVGAAFLLYKAWITNFGGIQDKVKAARDAIVPMLNSVQSFLQENIPKALDSLQKSFQTAFNWIQQNVVPTVAAVITALSKFWTEVQPKLIAALSVMHKNIQETFDNIAKVVRPIIQAFVQFIHDHWDDIVAITRVIFELLKGIIEEGWNFIATLIKVGLDILSGNWKAVWEDIQEGFKNAWNVMASTVQNIWTVIKGHVADGINAVISAINSFVDQINSIQIHIPGVSVGGKEVGKFDWGGMNLGHLGMVKFDTGGVFRAGPQGAPAWLHDREMILNDRQQSKLFDLLSGKLGHMNGGVTINAQVQGQQDYNQLAYKLAWAMRNAR